jgi:chemotaxis protein methyltransferase CheR
MNVSLTPELLGEFSDFVAAHMGLHFPSDRWPDLLRGIRSAAQEAGITHVEAWVRKLMTAKLSRHQLELLASHLTVGETYFYREHRIYEILTNQILPEFIQARRGREPHLRLWSAGCCTGEEAYSLAIAVHHALPDLPNWQVTILATDINPHFLHKAETAEYGDWSFRDAPAWLKGGYFTPAGPGQYRLLPAIKHMVAFEYSNLVEDAYPELSTTTNAMDVIFCRNVLMYFTPQQTRRVLAKLHHALVDGGWLVLSATETMQGLSRDFIPVNFSGVFAYQKGSSRPPTKFIAPPAAPAGPPPATVPAAPAPAAPLRVAHAPKAEVLHARAEKYYAEGRYPAATDVLLQLCARPTPEQRSRVLLVHCLANQGRFAEALDWSDRVVAADKLNPGGHYLRATILLEQGALDEARRALQNVLFLNREFVLAHFALGNLARTAGKFPEAQKHFANALHCLRGRNPDAILPESDGITVGRLTEIIASTLEAEAVIE